MMAVHNEAANGLTHAKHTSLMAFRWLTP